MAALAPYFGEVIITVQSGLQNVPKVCMTNAVIIIIIIIVYRFILMMLGEWCVLMNTLRMLMLMCYANKLDTALQLDTLCLKGVIVLCGIVTSLL